MGISRAWIHARRQTVLLNEGHQFAKQFRFPLLDDGFGIAAHRKRAHRAIVDCHANVVHRIRHGRIRLGNPLDLSAAFLAVALQHTDDVLVGAQDCGVDAAFLTQLKRVQDLVFREVVLQERRDVQQVSAVGKTAEEVASTNEAGDLELPDPRGWRPLRGWPWSDGLRPSIICAFSGRVSNVAQAAVAHAPTNCRRPTGFSMEGVYQIGTRISVVRPGAPAPSNRGRCGCRHGGRHSPLSRLRNRRVRR